jgi:hypothetical protein
MTDVDEIDQLARLVPVARLRIRTTDGSEIAHDLSLGEALALWHQLDDAIGQVTPADPRSLPSAKTEPAPAVMPRWGEITGTCNPCFFSQEVADEFDAQHPVKALPRNALVTEQELEIERIARDLIQKHVNPDLVLDLMVCFNAVRGMPPLEQAECEGIVARSLEREANYMARAAHGTPQL